LRWWRWCRWCRYYRQCRLYRYYRWCRQPTKGTEGGVRQRLSLWFWGTQFCVFVWARLFNESLVSKGRNTLQCSCRRIDHTKLYCYSPFSLERRWSSRRFPYGYLVTTSSQSPPTP
jgi:hypothetical protein